VGRHPRYFEAWIGLGRAYAGAGLEERAQDALRAVVDARPPAPEELVAEAAGLAEALEDRDVVTDTEDTR
jgi:hypothetical protein